MQVRKLKQELSSEDRKDMEMADQNKYDMLHDMMSGHVRSKPDSLIPHPETRLSSTSHAPRQLSCRILPGAALAFFRR